MAAKSAMFASFAGASSVAVAFQFGYDFRKSNTFMAMSNQAVKLLRMVDPETAHGLTINCAKSGLLPVMDKSEFDEKLATQVWGIDFKSPLGLAAGFDKQGEAVANLLEMGFGFIEVGGVTPKPQPGNAKPRMFRLPEDRAVINRFGLNSDGAEVVAERLQNTRSCLTGPVGVNLAKNTSSDDALGDYVTGVQTLGPHVDFIVLNVSCPNVKWTSKLSGADIENLVKGVEKARNDLERRIPFLMKLGPDMSLASRKHMATIAKECKVDGLIVSNTTSTRPSELKNSNSKERGGLSGEPITEMALETLRDMYKLTNGEIPLIGVGGISSAEQAYERIRAGASLIQVYTALVYQGPGLVKEINCEIAKFLERDGFKNVQEAVGVDVALN